MKRWTLGLAVGCLATIPLLAAAQFAKPDDAIYYRQSAMNLMGNHVGRLGAMAQGKVPWDTKVAIENVAVVQAIHKLPFAAFGEGTDKGKTKAKPEIWADRAKFEKARDNMFANVAKLSEAAKGGQEAALKSAIGDTGAACKNCHDDFRSR
ncbi:MAG: cytochrome c [Burkholderiaceae bacterium]